MINGVLQECESTKTAIFWNVWVFLAMPATWLAWSLIFFVVCLISFIWRAGSLDDEKMRELSSSRALLPRVIASSIFGVGFVYFILIVLTLRRYGSLMDQKWKARVRSWLVAPGFNYLGTWVQPVPSIVGMPPYPSGSGKTWMQPVPSATTYLPGTAPPIQPYPIRPYSMTSSSSNLPRRPRHSTARRKGPVRVIIPSPHHTARSDPLHVEGAPNSPTKKIKLMKLVDLSPDQEFYAPDEDLISCQISREKWTELNTVCLDFLFSTSFLLIRVFLNDDG